MKQLLCHGPVLVALDFLRPFTLEVDASAVGAGAVLMQGHSGGAYHPVRFFSRKFNAHQNKYSTTEKESMTLLWILKHLEVYIVSCCLPLVVYTDHNALVFLSRMYNQNQQLMRWALLNQDHNLIIRHKKTRPMS